LTIELDKLISYVDALNELSARLTSGSAVGGEISLGETTILAASPSKEAMQSQWNHLTSLVETVAKDSKKEVEFVSSGLAESNLSEGQKKLVNDVSIQLIRNSIVHGIELPKNRLKNNKPSVGRVDLRLAQLSDGRVELVVRDDGNGLDVESIKSRIIERGLASEKEVEDWSDQKVVSMAFTPGFTTSEETTMHAGRGVGLDLIRDSIKAVGGHLRLRQAAGKYCQFEIILPADA